VWGQDNLHKHQYESNEAYFTFVALDENNHPSPVPGLIPESETEKEQYQGALRRRQLRLILARKMSPSDASELKALFMPVE
ncbi:MAG TPA: hypothetical protein VL053_17670, partial [Arachidicoccus sp.]|nr:hypothetical protein [Arachidicoccus sp.]